MISGVSKDMKYFLIVKPSNLREPIPNHDLVERAK